MTRTRVWLIQQGIWEMALESMPLAAGYLKATALQDERLAAAMDIRIINFDGGKTLFGMASELFAEEAPDIIAFSVLGWNYRSFAALAETFKQINPDGWVVFGGNHVANQAKRVFGMFPDVDIVVNGEGELTFCDILHAHLDGKARNELGGILGISFQSGYGGFVTTEERPRIEDLDTIASPVLTGTLELTDDEGNFRYDVALMETNRGCPYRCSFCYWGGAVGQRVRAFSRERLRQEVELFAKHKVHTIVMCDANFGMLPIDLEFVEDVIEIRQRLGFPKSIETSWAKNKSKLFYQIVSAMKEAGLHSSFTLALQTLNPDALEGMQRRNMKVNDWESLAEWLGKEGMACYAELIWGAPGETVESFMEGYDRLANHVSRVAVYPMLILPNTAYAEKRAEHGLITVRGNNDDFMYLIAHNTMTPQDNRYMHRFIFFSRLVAENPVFRFLWGPLRELGGITQSETIRSLIDWFERSTHPAAEPFQHGLNSSFTDSDVLGPVVEYVYGTVEAKEELRRWWRESLLPRVPSEHATLLDTAFEYDLLTLPAYSSPGREPSPLYANETLPLVEVEGDLFHVRHHITLACDVPAMCLALRRGESYAHTVGEQETSLYYKAGARNFVTSTNHEEIVYYMGRLAREMFSDNRRGVVSHD
ncbi:MULTISPECIES: KedN5 family methylcobalamin-dependent radical SAM C-methyltransferase [unclassified Crossiella]|uniref:KedN5 family methylcobalamin-dependent radical SAM C-methyltransferase n=1 Tax=unclassified Crossiella TaxID=2620835 RepID=UPI00200043BA|nr:MULTISPECIES: KedN5 family methylcobalamin-dependent radical SAM C-methyltransferase [unclassified Crossiella]MCK2239289.1 KedN5 family methylcobalamin-dependent radical SAM C-methyltransferase [Crossiella sp. S99.2]MCK2251141.1 KedN5 family methylcobalamin-dependent radical SAM C-methyltransferase [Crossiella sp. S99.1]